MRDSTFSWLPKATRENAHPYYLNQFRRKIFLGVTTPYVLSLIAIFYAFSVSEVGAVSFGAYVAISVFTIMEIMGYWYWIEVLNVSNKSGMIGTLTIGSLPLLVTIVALWVR